MFNYVLHYVQKMMQLFNIYFNCALVHANHETVSFVRKFIESAMTYNNFYFNCQHVKISIRAIRRD